MCGMYAIEFLILKLNNKNIKFKSDSQFNKKRKEYFY